MSAWCINVAFTDLHYYNHTDINVSIFVYSEVIGANNVAEKTERKEGHEYYNDVPGKEPPAGGLLDKRTKVEITGSRPDGDKKDPNVGPTTF